MVEIRIGDIDSKGTNGGTEYIIDLKPTISAVSVRLVEILDDSNRLRVEQLINEYVDGLAGAQLKQAMLASYDEFVAGRKREIKVVR
jgi:hypothetical protein